jgi:small-conductance mechanosensitive channel
MLIMFEKPFRVGHYIRLTYDTKLATLEAFVEGIRKVILGHDLTDKDNIQVSFNTLADSSLDILVILPLFPSELKGRH